MAIKVISGKTYNCVREQIVKEILNNLSLDIVNYVIVPDNLVRLVKKELVRLSGTKTIFNLKVIGFNSLCKEFLKTNKKIISKEQGFIIFKSIIAKNKDNLKSYANIVGNIGAERELYELINIIADSCINSEELHSAGLSIGSISGEKIQDIALLYKLYYDTIKSKYADKHIMFDELIQFLKQDNLPLNYKFYVLEFGSMTKQQLNILNSMAMLKNDLTIGVVSNEKSENKRIYPRFLEDFCKNNTIEKVNIAKNYELEKDILLDNIFGYKTICTKNERDSISVRFAENICLEVKGLCREIRKLIVEGGKRYKDIAILCPDINGYKQDIKRQFEIFEIPYFMQTKTDLSSFAVAKLLIDGVGAVNSNFEKEKVLAFTKNILLDIAIDDICKFDLYVSKYNIDGSMFLDKFVSGQTDVFYDAAESVRSKVVEILNILNETSNISVADKILQFYNKIFEDKTYDFYLNKIIMSDGINLKQECELAYSKLLEIVSATQEMADYCDSINMLEQIINNVQNTQISCGRQYIDNVFITNDKKQIFDTDILFIMGANDGVLIKENNIISLFTYSELENLSKQKINFVPNLYDINYADKFEAVQLIAKGKKVIISYCGEAGEPSLFVKDICKLFDIKPLPFIADNNKIGMSDSDYAVKIGTKANAKSELFNYYSERMRNISVGSVSVFDYLYTKLKGEYKYQNIIKQKDFQFIRPNKLAWSEKDGKTFASISAIERYFDCPFKFYCEKTLKLKPVQTSGLDSLFVGNFLHRILEKFFRRYKNFDMQEEEINKITNLLCEETLKEKDFEYVAKANNQNVLENSLCKKARYVLNKLVKVKKRSNFDVANTELTFGFDFSDLPPYELKSNNNIYYIRGKIDRIDKDGDYIAIIDYKSKNSITYGLKEVYYGERVQLLIYLNAYMTKSNDKPFALFYMPLPYTYCKEDSRSDYSYSGFVRNLPNVISDFDTVFWDKNISSIPVGINKNGELSEKGLLSEEDLNILRMYADKVVAKAIEEIESGYIEAKPTSCDNCDFGRICLNKNNPMIKRTKNSATNFALKSEDTKDGEDTI